MRKIIFLFIGVLLSGCFAKPTIPAVENTIELTASQQTIQVGESLGLTIEVSTSQPLKEVYLSVQGEPYSRSEIASKGEKTLILIEKTWVADQPGLVRIEAYALCNDGTVIGPSAKEITVKVKNTPTNDPMQSIAENEEGSSTQPATLQPTTTPTVPQVELKLNINVDNDYLFPGDCTMLRWKAEDVNAVWLDGAIVDKEDAREICPTETSEYVLEAVQDGAKDSTSVLVVVEEFLEDDSIGPVVTEMAFSPAIINIGENCPDENSTFSVKISDDSDVLLTSLFYRVTSGELVGQWMEVLLEETGVDAYTYSFGSADLEESLEGTAEGMVEYYVDAMDFMLNETKTEVQTIPIQTCK